MTRVFNKKIRKIGKKYKIGDYVFVCIYSDSDVCDPWRIGTINQIVYNPTNVKIKINGSNKYWGRARLITQQEGEYLLKRYGEKSNEM